MVVTKLTIQLAFVGDKPYTTTCLLWWQALHWDVKMVARLAHGVINLISSLAEVGDKPYTETCSWWWQTLHRDLLMMVTNITLILAHGGDKPYTESCSGWLEILHHTETCLWWWQTLHWVMLRMITNLILRLAPSKYIGYKCYICFRPGMGQFFSLSHLSLVTLFFAVSSENIYPMYCFGHSSS